MTIQENHDTEVKTVPATCSYYVGNKAKRLVELHINKHLYCAATPRTETANQFDCPSGVLVSCLNFDYQCPANKVRISLGDTHSDDGQCKILD